MHYTLFMNTMRMVAFDKFHRTNPDATDLEREQVAMVINEMTGRTAISTEWEKGYMRATQPFLFAPRLYLSQFKTWGRTAQAIGYGAGYAANATLRKMGQDPKFLKPDPTKPDMMPPSVVKFILMKQVQALTGYAMTATIIGFLRSLAMDDEEREEFQWGWGLDMNVHSSNFLKFHFGDMAVEGLGGMGTSLRTISRAGAVAWYNKGEKLEDDYIKNQIREKFYYNNESVAGVMFDYLKNRVNPGFRAAAGILGGEDFFGLPYGGFGIPGTDIDYIPGSATVAAIGMAFAPIPVESLIDGAVRHKAPGTEANYFNEAVSAGLNSLGINARDLPKMQTFEAFNIMYTARVGFPQALVSSIDENVRLTPETAFYFKEEFSDQVGQYIIDNFGDRPNEWLRVNSETIKGNVNAYARDVRKRLEAKYLKYLSDNKK
jgi:hypothetical protein